MASAPEIRAAIEKRVMGIWTVGVTDDPERRKTQHKNPKAWKQWNAGSETAARNIEKHFLDKGMKGGGGGGGKADYVYIF